MCNCFSRALSVTPASAEKIKCILGHPVSTRNLKSNRHWEMDRTNRPHAAHNTDQSVHVDGGDFPLCNCYASWWTVEYHDRFHPTNEQGEQMFSFFESHVFRRQIRYCRLPVLLWPWWGRSNTGFWITKWCSKDLCSILVGNPLLIDKKIEEMCRHNQKITTKNETIWMACIFWLIVSGCVIPMWDFSPTVVTKVLILDRKCHLPSLNRLSSVYRWNEALVKQKRACS